MESVSILILRCWDLNLWANLSLRLGLKSLRNPLRLFFEGGVLEASTIWWFTFGSETLSESVAHVLELSTRREEWADGESNIWGTIFIIANPPRTNFHAKEPWRIHEITDTNHTDEYFCYRSNCRTVSSDLSWQSAKAYLKIFKNINMHILCALRIILLFDLKRHRSPVGSFF